MSPASVLALQRQIGNEAVGRLLRAPRPQPVNGRQRAIARVPATMSERILGLLIKPPPAGDAAAAETWRAKLVTLFESVATDQAEPLHKRLTKVKSKDDFTIVFQRLPGDLQTKLLGILSEKFAPAPVTQPATPAPQAPTSPPPDPTELFGSWVDDFEEGFYDIEYRIDEGGSPSNWIRLRYADGTVIDLNWWEDFENRKLSGAERLDALKNRYVGQGKRVFPSVLTPDTVPRLWEVRQVAEDAANQSTIDLMKLSLIAVTMVITINMPVGRLPTDPVTPVRTTRRVPRTSPGILPDPPAGGPGPQPKPPQASGPAPPTAPPALKVPTLTGTDIKSLYNAAIEILRSTPPSQRKEMWRALAKQIEDSPPGKAIGWQGAKSMPSPDGSTVFFGSKGPFLAITKDGSAWRGLVVNPEHIKFVGGRVTAVFFENLEKLM